MKRTLKGIVATLVASFVMSVIPLSTLAATEVEINADNFGSDSFASYLKTVEKTTAGCNGDGKFSDSELKLIKSLKPDSSVTRIIGLKFFSNLKELDVSACYKLTRLNASKATSLNTLKLGSIENLEFLYVMNTAVSSIDVSNLAGLKKLYLSESPVTSINLANNTDLLELGLDGTAITSLDISACTNLRSLDISNNGDAIESLNIGHNIWLVRAGVGGDKKSEDNVIEYKKTQDDIEYLLRLDSGTNVYCAIDETIFPDLVFRKEIESKDPNKDGILSLDELIDFQFLNINGDYKLKSIEGIEIFYNLDSLWLQCCKLPYVDLSDNPNISKLELSNCSTREINLDNLKCLNSLTVFACELTKLVFPDNSEISVLNVSSNFNLKNLDLSNLSKLTRLNCDQCGISELDISNQKLTTLSCVRNGITALDLSGQNQLSFLFCEGNEITSFDLSDTKLNEMMNSIIYKDGRFIDNYNGSRFSCDNTVEIKGLTCPLITPTVAPIVTPTVTPVVTPTSTPSKTPTVTPTAAPTSKPTDAPTLTPSKTPTVPPTATPTSKPTGAPTSVPSVAPTKVPVATATPTAKPTVVPTKTPTAVPTTRPTGAPTSAPSVAPTMVPVATTTPTAKPTVVPTKTPTAVPTTKPTAAPTKAPAITLAATPKPTVVATSIPKPTNVATTTPTSVPTVEPTKAPSVEDFAERLYTTCLGRAAEQAGKDYWVSELKAGKPGSEVAQGFFFSPEFVGFNLDNEEYITRLYRTFMGREPDKDGIEYWSSEMEKGMDRKFVFDGFVNSPEWADICLTYGIRSGGLATPTFEKDASPEVLAFAERLYTTCLGRKAEEAGLKYWSQELANLRQTGTVAAAGFFYSPEFIGLNTSDDEYVTRLYRTFMGREPEEAGFEFWTEELKAGKGRDYVFDGFAASPEWIGICADYGILR